MLKAIRVFLFFAVSLGAASFLRATEWMLPRGGRHRYRYALQTLWAKGVWRILGLSVEVRGTRPSGGPFLIVSNHLGYLDIAVLAGVLPVTFVSKEEVRRWPLLGFLARSAGTIFVSREDRVRARDFVNRVGDRLAGGEDVLVFPEGTSSRGNTVLPFKTAAFASVSRKPFPRVVPVRIDLLEVGGEPVTDPLRDVACWHGDMEFAPHFWNFLGSGGARFRVSIGGPARSESLDRKTIARFARDKMIALEQETRRCGALLPGGWIWVHPVP